LRDFLKEAFGWKVEKTDKTLLPIVRKMNRVKKVATDGGEEQQVFSSGDAADYTSGEKKHTSEHIQNIVEK
jgi:hypothetical protein